MRYNTQRLDRERILKGWTQEDLARAARLTAGMVSYALRHGKGTARTFKKLADALGLSMSEILIEEKTLSATRKAS